METLNNLTTTFKSDVVPTNTRRTDNTRTRRKTRTKKTTGSKTDHLQDDDNTALSAGDWMGHCGFGDFYGDVQ